MQAIKFKELREYCARIDKVSIRFVGKEEYENYLFISRVPDSYNEKYVYGIGAIESEFYVCDEHFFWPCIEIMLSDKPRFDEEGNENIQIYTHESSNQPPIQDD